MPLATLAEHADSVTICLSKGLSAPVGSVLAGSGEYIAQARRARKLLGGAMRQVGMVAAAGLVAIREQLPLLGEDHRVAAQLAEALAGIEGIGVDAPAIRTNMVMVDTTATGRSAGEVVKRLGERGIKASARPPWQIRFVTHREIREPEVARLVESLRAIVS